MKFPWRIIGHEKLLESLEKDFLQDRLAHAYLFCGPKETGKFRLAREFAQLMQCTEENLCRSCENCLQISRNIHSGTTTVDRLWMKDRAEDFELLAKYSNFDQSHRKKDGKKSDQIGVDDVFVFTESLYQKTTAPFKICLIRDAERMTTAAMNTLLKILEEPPEKTIFLLTATHRDALLSTIVSRTRVMDVHLVPNSVLSTALQEEAPELSEEKQKQLLTLAQGRPARLMRLLNDSNFLRGQEELFHELAVLIKNKDVRQYMDYAERFAKSENQGDLAVFFDALLHFLRTLLREKSFGREFALSKQLSVENLLTMVRSVEIAMQRIERNVNKRLTLESMFFAWR